MNVSLDDKYSLDKGRAFMTGIEALVRLPMLQHQRDLERGLNTACYISGYRGSPIGGLDQALWQAKRFTAKHNIFFRPGVNEDLAMTSVWGSQQVGLFPGAKFDGVFGMWYGKGPGLDRSMDVLKHANAFGTSAYGGVLAVVGDDHACKSSTLPHQSDHMFIGATVPVLNPADVQEVLDLGVLGWELSRYCGCWVGLKAITENMDAAISAEIDPARVKVVIPDDYTLPADGVHARWPDTPMAQEERLQRHKIYAARAFARANNLNRIEIDSDNARLGIITTGKSYLDTLQALEDLGIDDELAAKIGIRLFKVGMSWPLEPVMTHRFADGLEEILVVEEKRSVIEDQLTGQLYNWPVEKRPRVVGEYDENRNLLVTNLGELTPAMIARVIAARIARFFDSESIHERLEFLEQKEAALARQRDRAERKPWFCSGCPHNTSTRVPDGSVAYGGIGCHYMATWMDRDTETFTQMGGEGATWLGQAPFTETRHVFQNLGDGTYFHSGLLAIRAAVAAGVNITYKILYNDAVAMTGGQPLDGQLSVEQLVAQLRAEGLHRIALVSDRPELYRGAFSRQAGVTVSHRDRLESIQLELRETEGCTAIVYAQTCAAEKRRRRKQGMLEDPPKRIFINDAVCEGCGDCGVQSNCLSILPKETPLGRKRAIDQSACNKDYSCVKGFCPSFVSVHGGQLRKHQPDSRDGDWPDPVEPRRVGVDDPFNILITGIGGTGILTIGAVLGMAAHIEEKGTSVLNQTGLAQKFGAVTAHVRIAANQAAIHAMRIPAGEAQLMLGADLVVSSGDDALSKLNAEHSWVVVNNHLSPTAEFTGNPDAVFPVQEMEQAIAGEIQAGRGRFVDATAIATRLMGDAIFANFMLLGIAYQQGLVPIGAAAIHAAIELNGVAVAQNQQAFLWGRRYVADPLAVMREAGVGEPAAASQQDASLEELIAARRALLIDYQDRAYAERYLHLVERVRQREGELQPQLAGAALPLSRAVAEAYYRLLAYKDEYEVARLYSNGDFERSLAEQFEGEYKIRFHLAPPLLAKRDPVSGKPLKREFGGWMLGLFRLLARFRGLRGSAVDVFGYSAERRQERALISEYESDVDTILAQVSPENLDIAVELARLPLQMRGFGHVKQANIERVQQRRAQLRRRLCGRDLAVELFSP